MTNFVEEMLYGPGRCKCCGKFKPLAMVAMPGLYTDEETGEVAGESVIDPNNRTGYCEPCALQMARDGKFDPRPN